MALTTPTALVSNFNNTSQTSRTTALFTPSANAVIFAAFHVVGTGNPTDPTFSDSVGLTWNAVSSGTFNSSNRVTVKWAEVGASPTSMTVTADYGAYSASSGSWGVFEMTGHATGAPIVTSSTVTGTGTSTTPATSAAPALAASGNIQLLWVAARSTSCAPEAGWTEIFDKAGTQVELAAYYIGTPGDTSPTATLPGSALWRAIGCEVASGGMTLAASGSELTVASGTATYSGAFNAFRGLVLKWP